MCAIGGIVDLRGGPVEESSLRKMAALMADRGPDHRGLWIRGNVGLLHNRLRILDPSPRSHQPMIDPEGTSALTFNGAIYNFPLLRKELEREGCRFLTESDTEVLLNGYRRWGLERLLHALEGMFAFALWDGVRRKVVLARDRFGEKPLYYRLGDHRLVFASDIRAIRAVTPGLRLDYESLDYYLVEMTMPQPKTVWEEVRQVRPHCRLELDLDSARWDESSYWNLRYDEPVPLSDEEAERQVEAALAEAVRKRTRADVPVGAFLSGGVDSGLVVALLARQTGGRFRTFSVGFRESDFDESGDARRVAERYGTDHTEVILGPDLRDTVLDLVTHFGEPFADSSCLPTHLLCREMKRHVDVALSGDGADELFGYPGYDRVNRKAPLLRGMAFRPGELDGLYRDDARRRAKGFALRELEAVWSRFDRGTPTERLFAASLETRLLNDYLVKVDRASMRTALEVRSPFLDRALVELAFRLPMDLRIREGNAKHLLKRIAERHVAPGIYTRRKRGFALPLTHWLRTGLRELVRDTLSEEAVKRRGLFSPGFVSRLVADHERGSADHTHRIWCLVWLELWFRAFQDGGWT